VGGMHLLRVQGSGRRHGGRVGMGMGMERGRGMRRGMRRGRGRDGAVLQRAVSSVQCFASTMGSCGIQNSE
jgi:hypothetical protein